MDSLLEIQNLNVFYDKTHAVKDFNLTVENKQIVALIGASGSGKSTILHAITGLLNNNTKISGNISYKNNRINSVLPENRNIPMLFQNLSLFPHLSVEENISFPLKIKKYDSAFINKKIYDVIQLVHLKKEYLKRNISNLSGGEQQRVAICRALINLIDNDSNNLLLLDEPLSSLDAYLKDEIINEIINLKRKLKLSILYVTHDREEALKLADKIAIIDNGMLLQVGSVVELYNKPTSKFIAAFLDIKNFFEASVVEINSDYCFLKIRSNDKTIKVLKGKNIYSLNDIVYITVKPICIKINDNVNEMDYNIITDNISKITCFGDYWEVVVGDFYMKSSKEIKNIHEGQQVKISWKIHETKIIEEVI